MSSHHFVKEGQEPALLIADVSSLSHIENVLEWAPLVLVMDHAVDKVLSWGIKADVIITESARVNEITKRLEEQMPVKILSSSSLDNHFEAVFYFLISIRQHAVIISADNPHLHFEAAAAFSDRLEITFLSDVAKWSAVPHRHFKKWIPANTKLLTYGEPIHISAEGKFQQKDDHVLILEDGLVTLESDRLFWIGEAL